MIRSHTGLGNLQGTAMKVELDEVVAPDISDDALELAAGGAQGGRSFISVCMTAVCSLC
jgi:hypothetical protein